MPYTHQIKQVAVFNKTVKTVMDALKIKYIVEGENLIITVEEVKKAEEKFHSLTMAQLAFRNHLNKNKGEDMYWEMKGGSG